MTAVGPLQKIFSGQVGHYSNELAGKSLGNSYPELLPANLQVCDIINLLHDPGYVDIARNDMLHTAWYVASGAIKYPMSKESKELKNLTILQYAPGHLSHMSQESNVHSTLQ